MHASPPLLSPVRLAPVLLSLVLGCGSGSTATSSSTSGAAAEGPLRAASVARTGAPTSKEERHTSKYLDAMRRMESRPAVERRQFAAAALAELTKGSLPEPLRAAFEQVSQVEPRMGRLVLMKALSEVVPEWTELCPAGPTALADMAKLRPEDQARHLWITCKLSGSGLVSEAEASKTDGIALAAALTVANKLGKSEDERDLLAFFLRASPVETRDP